MNHFEGTVSVVPWDLIASRNVLEDHWKGLIRLNLCTSIIARKPIRVRRHLTNLQLLPAIVTRNPMRAFPVITPPFAINLIATHRALEQFLPITHRTV